MSAGVKRSKGRRHPLDFPGSQAVLITDSNGNKYWPIGLVVELVSGAAEDGSIVVWHTGGWVGVASHGYKAIGPVARELLKVRR